MNDFSNLTISVAAMAVSCATTYLTFFDERYTLTATLAQLSAQVQGGMGSNGERRTLSSRTFMTANVLLSNRGTRPVVLSDMELLKSSDADACEPMDDVKIWDIRFDPVIIEPGTVETHVVEMELPAYNAEAVGDEPFELLNETALWCIKWTAFDPEGRRREPVTPFFTLTREMKQPEDGDWSPEVSVEMDYPQAPETIVAKGLF